MRSFIALILLSAILSVHAVSEGENKALNALFTNFPALASASPPWTSNTSAACDQPSFYGLTCSDGPETHVLKLELDLPRLAGSMPKEISELSWLETLSIRNACVSAALPSTLGRLTSLTVLDLSYPYDHNCSAEKPTPTIIPDSLTNLTKLVTLSLSMGSLSGPLPRNFGNLRLVEHLVLSTPTFDGSLSNLTGNIPFSIFQMTQLKSLKVESTLFTSFEGIPNSGFPALQSLSFASSARFNSPMDALLNSSRALQSIDFSNTLIYTLHSIGNYLNNVTSIILDKSNTRMDLSDDFWAQNLRLQHFSAAGCYKLRGYLTPPSYILRDLAYLDLSSTAVTISLATLESSPLQVLNLSRVSVQDIHLVASLYSTLRILDLSNLNSGFQPAPSVSLFTSFTRIEKLYLSHSNFNGTIPFSFTRFLNLTELKIDNNQLYGTLPSIQGEKLKIFEIQGNRFTGTIPRSIASRVSVLKAGYNQFSGIMDEDLFADNAVLNELSIAHNMFTGLLPLLNTSRPIALVDMSNNQFSGGVPKSYCIAQRLILSHNRIAGSMSELLAQVCDTLESLDVSYNYLSGDRIPISDLVRLHTLIISFNWFNGELPMLPDSIRFFEAIENQFSSANFMYWARTSAVQSLRHLDISFNGISTDDSYTALIGPHLRFLSIAGNQFESGGYEPSSVPLTFPALTDLDLSGNQLFGEFPVGRYPSLSYLNLANNLYEGDMPLDRMPLLTQLDISQNRFRFDVVRFSALRSLVQLNASQNILFGTLTLDNLPNLVSADLSWNRLDHQIDLLSIGKLFRAGALNSLDIRFNPKIPRFQSMDSNLTGLARTTSSTPGTNLLLATGVTCYSTAFYGRSDRVFAYDDSLFNYEQCDCADGHYGIPLTCIRCPVQYSSCRGRSLDVWKNHYIFTEDTNYQYEAETCLTTTAQIMTGNSNCLGVQFVANGSSNMHSPIRAQCAPGSSGRLCSECHCSMSDGECWYFSDPVCVKCSFVLGLPATISLSLGLLFGAMLLTALISAFSLRKKRSQNLMPLKALSLPKRIFHRLLYLTSLGNVTILITFLQMLLAFTDWDTYAKLKVFGLINGNVQGLGLHCIFPFLSNPVAEQSFRTSLPYIGLLVVVIGVMIGGKLADRLEGRRREYELRLNRVAEAASEQEDDEDTVLLGSKRPSQETSIGVDYPTSSLITSLGFTVVKFLYFGTAIAAHEYLFPAYQPYTNAKYSKVKPYMKYADAWKIVSMSAPILLWADISAPFLFTVICLRKRNKLHTWATRIKYGPLFDHYTHKVFWWEMINIFKKLSIALVLKGFDSNDALQSALIVSILSGLLIIQQRLNPWLRQSENIMDGIASVILIGALLATRPTQLSHAPAVVWYVVAASIAFVLACVVLIIHQAVTGNTHYEKRRQEIVDFSTELTSMRQESERDYIADRLDAVGIHARS